MKLIFELLQITNEAEDVLFEHLGNLAQLKVGNMINILKQNTEPGSSGDYVVTPVDKKFAYKANYRKNYGHDSEIVDGGKVEDIAALRKVYKKHDGKPIAFALYVKNTAVAFGSYDSDALAGPSRQGILAFDFTMFKDQLEAAREARVDNHSSQYAKNHEPPVKITSYSEKTKEFSWESESKTKKYQGELMSTASLKEFFVSLKDLAGNETITCKLVLPDYKSKDKRSERYMNPAPSKGNLKQGLRDLAKRLTKFKLSKKPTASSIEEFIKATVTKNVNIIQFDGRTFTTAGVNVSSDAQMSLLQGGFEISYATVDPDNSDSLNISYIYDTETTCVVPYKAKWNGKDESGKLISREAILNAKSYFKREAILNAKSHLKKEYNINDSSDKQDIMKKLLTFVMNNTAHDAREMIKSLRDAGQDYPEFKIVEKSLDAGGAEKKDK